HFDHMGGILAVLEDATFAIGEIYFHTISRERCASEPWGCRWGQVTRLKELAASKSIPIRSYTNFSGIDFGSAKLLKIVAFDEGECPVECDINDESLIARL